MRHSTTEIGAPPARLPLAVTRYTLTAQALHWLSVLLIFTILSVAWVMISLPEGPEQARMLVVHRSVGVTIFAVVVVRLAWRLTHPAPPSPSGTSQVMEVISRVTHWLLYALLILMPITGYLQSADGRPVSYFGLLDLSALPKDKALGDFANVLHVIGQWDYTRWLACTSPQPYGTWLYDEMDC